MFSNSELRTIESLLENHSRRLSCAFTCYLMDFGHKKFYLEQRKKLRKNMLSQIQKKVTNLSNEQKKLLLTPGVPPHLPSRSLSLSHCFGLGGMIISESAQPSISFDLEQKNRIKAKTVAYISQEEELSQAPNPATLWSAKEAVFKSLNKFVIQAYMKQIIIFSWKIISSNGYDHSSKGYDHVPKEYKHGSRMYDHGQKVFDHTSNLYHSEAYDYEFKVLQKNLKGNGSVIFYKDIVIGIAKSFS